MLFAHLVVQDELYHCRRALIHQPTHVPLSPALPGPLWLRDPANIAGYGGGEGAEEKMGVKL